MQLRKMVNFLKQMGDISFFFTKIFPPALWVGTFICVFVLHCREWGILTMRLHLFQNLTAYFS